MKRIICMLTAVALCAAGLAANEPKLILNARTSANLMTVDFDESDNNLGIRLGGNDIFGLEYKGENAGAKITLLCNLNTGTVAIDEYLGWMKFGFLKLSAGRWSYRFANAVTADASSWATFERYRYGAIKNGTLVRESDNIAFWSQSEFAADATFGDFVLSAASGTNDANTAYHIQDQWAARAAYTIKDTASLSGSFIQSSEKLASAGVFANLLMVKNLALVAGYSGAYDYDEVKNNVHAAELRARFVMDKLSLTSHNNASFGDKTTTLYNMANVAYKINDNVTAALYASNVNISGKNAKVSTTVNHNGNTFSIRPGVTLMAQKGATIDAGPQFNFTTSPVKDDTSIMTFPVTFRVRF